MEELRLKATRRKDTGKGAMRKMRKAGAIPGVLYGRDTESLALTIAEKDWRLIQGHVRSTTIIRMELADNDASEEHPVMVKEIQREVIGRGLLHIDFLQVSMERQIQVQVPVHLVGTAKGVVAGGVVEHHLHAVLVECLPGNIPNRIEVDISNLEIGDSIHVRAVSIPGVKLLDSPDVAIVGVTPPEAEEKAGAVPEAEEPAKVE